MIITTTDTVEGKNIKRVIGLVKGNTVRAKIFLTDWIAGLRNFFGGEVIEYTKLIAESREQAIDRMKANAAKEGANAVVAVRMTTASIVEGSAEILVYGTAVEVE